MWAAHPISKRAPPLIVVADTNVNANMSIDGQQTRTRMRTDAKNGENHPEDQINQNVGQYNPPRMWAAHPISKRAPPLNVVADTNMNTNRTRERCSSTSSQIPACAAQRQQTADGKDLVGSRCHVRHRVTVFEVEGLSPPISPVSCNVHGIPPVP